jgi:biopolymer transport protein ExbB/TolQ
MTLVDSLVNVAMLGATWVLWVLIALSLASVAVMVERWVFYRRSRRDGESLDAALEVAVAEDDDEAIRGALERSRAIEATVLRSAWAFRDGPAAFADAVDGAVAGVRHQLDRGSTLLGTIGNNAPFVGLFGTVLGVIEAFSYLGTGDQSAMGNVMGGISEALVATAVGIVVAIPSVVGFNLVQKQSGEIETRVVALSKLLSAWLRVRERGERVAVERNPTLARTGRV